MNPEEGRWANRIWSDFEWKVESIPVAIEKNLQAWSMTGKDFLTYKEVFQDLQTVLAKRMYVLQQNARKVEWTKQRALRATDALVYILRESMEEVVVNTGVTARWPGLFGNGKWRMAVMRRVQVYLRQRSVENAEALCDCLWEESTRSEMQSVALGRAKKDEDFNVLKPFLENAENLLGVHIKLRSEVD